MKYIFLSSLFVLLFSSCINYNKGYSDEETIAVIGNNEIKLKQIDSIIELDIYKLRKKAIENLIAKELLQLESKKRGISSDKLYDIEIVSKTKPPSENDIKEFILLNKGFDNKKTDVEQILININQSELLNKFIDSLTLIYPIQDKLRPCPVLRVNTDSLFCFSLNRSNSTVEVILVFNFDCNHCVNSFSSFYSIFQKYQDHLSFKLIYLDSHYSDIGKVLIAAHKQQLFLEILLRIINNTSINNGEVDLQLVLKDLNLNNSNFIKDYNDIMNLKPLLLTRDKLISLGINKTPSLIINGNYYDDDQIIEKIELLLNLYNQ